MMIEFSPYICFSLMSLSGSNLNQLHSISWTLQAYQSQIPHNSCQMYRSSHSITLPDMCVLGVNVDVVMWHVTSIMCTKTWNVPSTVSGSVQTPHKQLLNHKHASNLKSSYCEGDEMTETGLWWKACCVVTVSGAFMVKSMTSESQMQFIAWVTFLSMFLSLLRGGF